MKKYRILFAAALLALISCEKRQELQQAGDDGIVFTLSADYCEDGPLTAASKAVKSDWESGDVIFVFLDKVPAPKYIRMSYDDSKWTSALMNGEESISSFALTDEQKSGTMRAVYLPFGNTTSVVADSTQFNFKKAYSTYYLTDTKAYSVSADNTVDVAFSMSIPSGYVQFFVTDSTAVNEACFLATDVVRPVAVKGVAADGNLVLTPGNAGDNMPGYAYGSDSKIGHLFSGVLVPEYHTAYGSNYYLALSENKSGGKRFDLFVQKEVALASHDAVKLPDMGHARWQQVGPSVYVSLQKQNTSCGTWATCNVTASVPEGLPLHNYTGASSHETDNYKLPTGEQFALLDPLSWTWLSVHGTKGYVVSSSTGFLFLPVTRSALVSDQFYWGAAVPKSDPKEVKVMKVNSTGHTVITKTTLTSSHSARLIQAN